MGGAIICMAAECALLLGLAERRKYQIAQAIGHRAELIRNGQSHVLVKDGDVAVVKTESEIARRVQQ